MQILQAGQRQALSVRDFRRVWTGASVSLLGTQVTVLALPTVFVLSIHGGPLEISLISAAQYAAMLLGLTWAGRVADRFDPRTIMVACDTARAAALASILVMSVLARPQVWAVLLVAAVIGFASAFNDTAVAVVVPRALGADLRLYGNTLYAQSQYLAFSLGPPLAGLLVGFVGGGRAVVIDAGSYIISAYFAARLSGDVAGVSGRHDGSTATAPPSASRASAARMVLRNGALRSIALASATGNLGHQMVQGVYLLFLYRSYGLSPALVGLGFGVGGLAGIFGARAASPLARRLGNGGALMLATVSGGGSWLLLFVPGVPHLVVVGLAATLISFCMPLFGVVQSTLRQAVTSAERQGAAAAGVGFISLCTVPVGFFLGGALAQRAGLPTTVIAGAVVAMLSGFWCLPLLRDASADVPRVVTAEAPDSSAPKPATN